MDGPLTVLALVMVPLIVLPLVMELSPTTEWAFLAIDYLIWAVFAAEYAIKLYLAPNRGMVRPREHWRAPLGDRRTKDRLTG